MEDRTIDDANVGSGMTATMELLNNSNGLVIGPVTVKQNGTLRIIDSSLTADSTLSFSGGQAASVGPCSLSGWATLEAISA